MPTEEELDDAANRIAAKTADLCKKYAIPHSTVVTVATPIREMVNQLTNKTLRHRFGDRSDAIMAAALTMIADSLFHSCDMHGLSRDVKGD